MENHYATGLQADQTQTSVHKHVLPIDGFSVARTEPSRDALEVDGEEGDNKDDQSRLR